MVKVRGQIEEAPLLDMAAVNREYWTRKEILLPSLAKFMPKKKVWFGLKEVEQQPKIVLRRLTEEEWRSIDERFTELKLELAKDKQALVRLFAKNTKGEKLKATEWAVIHKSHAKAMPIYVAMLEYMIDEPQLTYEDTKRLLDSVNSHDKDTLLSYVNMLTTEKASVAKKIYDERMQELNKIQSGMVKP